MKMRLLGVLLCFALCHAAARGAEASWEAGGAAQGIELVTDKDAPYLPRTVDGETILAPPANADYMQRASIAFRVNDGLFAGAGVLYLAVEHRDQDIAMMQVRFDADFAANDKDPESNPAYAGARGEYGYTSLGTGKPRRAVFTLHKPAFKHRQKLGADLRIIGCGSLRKITLTDRPITPEAEPPLVLDPKVVLQRPLELVLQVGADAKKPEDLPGALAAMRELCPAARVLGFTGVESYVKWNFVEPEKDRFDWSFYDGVVAEARRYGLKWFPLLIVGSAYTLPTWYHDSPENTGFMCLEHRKQNKIQTIFNENQTPHVRRFLNAFGAHYEPAGALLGVRLGPSGNFGESQYPAGGNWGYQGEADHIHIGWWAADPDASPHFRAFLQKRYSGIQTLNQAWGSEYASFDAVETFVPQFAESQRKRKDVLDWYMGAMTDWCERWAVWAREAMPNTSIYQSSGGWGFVESGTDFTDQTRSMAKVRGGIRATNETDSYAQNFQVTRMMSSAARFYKVPFGSEPAGFGSARGVAARIYNILVNNGQHVFFYYGNILNNDQAVAKWLELAPLLDRRDDPVIDVAALYPDTLSKLDDGVFRHLHSSMFYARVAALRRHLDFDFCGESMVRDGALPRYKVLVFLWSHIVEADVLNAIDQWVQHGGTVIYPYWVRTPLSTVEDDYAVYNRWRRGETGRGRVIWYASDREPAHRYPDFIKEQLLARSDLQPLTQRMLRVEKPSEVYVSALNSGQLALLNFNDDSVQVTIPDQDPLPMQPYSIVLTP